jgi:hypothetical protein
MNGISAVYELGVQNPFHSYLKALLRRVLADSWSGICAVTAMTFMHFTVGRYGAWEYRGSHGPGCDDCVDFLREATGGAGLEWMPKLPPTNYVEGDEMRE